MFWSLPKDFGDINDQTKINLARFSFTTKTFSLKKKKKKRTFDEKNSTEHGQQIVYYITWATGQTCTKNLALINQLGKSHISWAKSHKFNLAN